MIIFWIQKSKKDKRQNISDDQNRSFKEHDETMRKFRLGHPELEAIYDNDILTGDGNLLAPVHNIKLAGNIQN